MYPVGKNNAIAKQAWATKLSEAWYPTTFMDKYGITGRPVQFHGHTFSGHPAIQIMSHTFLGSTETCVFKGRIIFMSMFNDIEYWIKDNQYVCSNKKKRSSRK